MINDPSMAGTRPSSGVSRVSMPHPASNAVAPSDATTRYVVCAMTHPAKTLASAQLTDMTPSTRPPATAL